MSNEPEKTEVEELAAAAAEAELATDADVEGHSADVEGEEGFTDINFGCHSAL
ncbi:hypothetical protein [Streptacidiphilus rugosus]|uniref:hypothetical protein n=1 Tax=Streptacidiphilus rugosus TaxID=405783 RepID=UPI000AA65D26|nr:hypothetical protein [Streptacidiphilus rugosus]